MSLPSSDLDLVICLPKVHKEAGPEAPGALEGRNAIKETWQQNLARYLRREDWVNVASITVIPNAPVPLLKLKTLAKPGEPSVSLDVSFEGQGHRGLEACKFHSILLRQYAALRPLVLVLKSFLSRRGLCEAYTGGLSSFALQLITARFLQEQHSPSTDVGALLLGLLNFFGDHLDPRITGISVARRCYFSRSAGVVVGSNSGGVLGSQSTTVRSENPLHAGGTGQSTVDQRRHSVGGPHHHVGVRSGHGVGAADTMGMMAGAAFGSGAPLGHHTNTGHITSYVPYKFDPLFVEDPLAPGNNVGRNCFRIYQVQRLFSETHSLLVSEIRRMEEDGNPRPLLEVLVGTVEDM